jgi:lysyl endopeptidase
MPTRRLKLRVLSAALLSLVTTAAFAAEPSALRWDRLEGVPAVKLKTIDWAGLAVEDEARDGKGTAYRIAAPNVVNLSAATDGVWREAGDAREWLLKVDAADAFHLNFGFGRIALPEGASFSILDAAGGVALGPYTADTLPPGGALWTPLMQGSRAVLKLSVPRTAKAQVRLELTQISQGYRGFGFTNSAARSGRCNTDVTCMAANDAWNVPRRSVAQLVIGGAFVCTGSLLNNTRRDRALILSTATHCEIYASNVSTVVAYFNYESATCRTPGSIASGNPLPRPSSSLTGATWLSASSSPFSSTFPSPSGPATDRTDWTLITLNTTANIASFNLHWAGWDRRAAAAQCSMPSNTSSTVGLCASIHHPSGDEKRITFSETPLISANIDTSINAHWFVQWDLTPPVLPNIAPPVPNPLPVSVTEGGSSGSPLYSPARRVVGVLSGGASLCGASNSDMNDQYGKLSVAYTGALLAGSATFASILDPDNLGVEILNGIDSATGDFLFSDGFID